MATETKLKLEAPEALTTVEPAEAAGLLRSAWVAWKGGADPNELVRPTCARPGTISVDRLPQRSSSASMRRVVSELGRTPRSSSRIRLQRS